MNKQKSNIFSGGGVTPLNKRRVLLKSYVWGHIVSNRLASLLNSIKGRFKNLTLIGNSVQGENPSPDNPQEIKSAGRKSKNLFNIADLRVGQVQKDGAINEKATTYRTAILDVPEDGKYRITFAENNDYNMLYFAEMYTNGVYSQPYVRVRAGNPNHYITLAKGKNILSFSTHTASGNIDFTTDHNIMIAAESETTDYEPYGYFFDLKITGKNIFNKNAAKQGYEFGSAATDVETAKQGWFVSDFMPVKAITYYISGKATGSGCKLYNKDKVFVKNTQVPFGNIKFDEGIAYFRINGEIKDLDTVQVEEGNVVTPYEPYREQTVQIALDEPLSGIGEYKDTITKDGVVRKIKRAVFDGSEDEHWFINNERENVIHFVPHRLGDAIKINEGQRSMMDKLKWSSGVWNRDEVGQDMFAGILRINMPKDLAPNLQTFKTWLSQNPLTVDYVLAEPVTEPLPESVQQQLQALHSENGTTHVFVDSGEVEAGISVTYKQKK